MPQTYETLRRRFMKDGSDGIAEATQVLRESGISVINGRIIDDAPGRFNVDEHTRGEIIDAMDFLMEEWDYSYVVADEPEEENAP